MKTFITGLFSLAFVISGLFARAQEAATMNIPIDKDSGMISYQEVVQEAGTADELYTRCIEWINRNYKNPADACRVRNRESAVIEILHRFELTNTEGDAKVPAGIVNYLLKLEFKAGRYRYTITELTLKQASRFPIEKWFDKTDKLYSPLWDTYLQQVDNQARQLIDNLKNGMMPVPEKQEVKW
ncbi:MAG: DUF4468 domain-containing protein [Bacteroidales bacterium]|nr:DUF4468 domain-containing protein [Bacteroidales bacterium]